MPRRKTLATSRREAPKAPPGKVGQELSGESRKEKIEVLLKDFDAEVEMRLQEMAADYRALELEIEKRYNLEIMKLPKAIQNMKFNEFIEAGGQVNVSQLQNQHRDVDELINSIKQRPTRKRKKGGAVVLPVMDTISEDGQNVEPLNTGKITKTATRAAETRRKAAAGITTPLNAHILNSTWETPLQTPAFDPRLPQTPAVKAGGLRRLKPGENILIYSVNGSPIQIDGKPMVIAPDNSKAKQGQSICVVTDMNIPRK